MKNKSISSKKKLMKRLSKDELIPESLINLLKMKPDKPIVINPRLIEGKKHYNRNENKLALEGVKLIKESNTILKQNKNKYNYNKQMNEIFESKFQRFKSSHNKTKYDEIKNFQFTFGNLLRSYENRGKIMDTKFLNKSIYTKSGILLRRKKLIFDYYSDEVKREGNQSKKIIKYNNFMNKLLGTTQKKLILKVIIPNNRSSKNLLKKIAGEIKPPNDEEKLQEKQKEIEKLISENDLLKQLIDIEENNFETTRRLGQLSDKKNNEEENKILLYTNENEKNDSEFNVSLNLEGKKNIISHNKESINIESIQHPETFRTIINEDNKLIGLDKSVKKYENLKSDRTMTNKKINKDKINRLISLNNSTKMRTIESGFFKTRLKNKIKKEKKIFPPIDKSYNKRKSNLIEIKNNSINSEKNMKKNNSQTNFTSVEDTYNRILKYNNSTKKNDNINKMMTEFYGNKIKGMDSKKAGINLLNFFYKMKGRTIQNEMSEQIYSKYKGLLPKKLENKIIIDKQLNEQIKNRATYYVQHYTNKFNQLSQISKTS